jgi:hypothetical protein
LRIVLVVVISGLLVTIGYLAALLLARRRRPAQPPERTPRRVHISPPQSIVTPVVRRASSGSGLSVVGGGGAGVAGTSGTSVAAKGATVPVSTGNTGPMSCPSCRREFAAGQSFCPHDSRRLVPASELADRPLNTVSLWEAMREKKDDSPTGVIAKICPSCGNRYDLSTTFCGKDGAELVTIN